MKKLGFALSYISNSLLSYYLDSEINKFLSSNFDTDIIVFYENMGRVNVRPMFSHMNLSEAWCYKGPIICTSLSTANFIVNMPGPPQVYYYVWELDWLNGLNYDAMRIVYNHPKIKLITRTQEHAKLIANNFNVMPLASIDKCNIQQFLDLVQEKK